MKSYNILILYLLFLSIGCSAHHVRDEVPVEMQIPDQWSNLSIESAESYGSGFCGDFSDPTLRALIERALSENLDLRAAWIRVEQSELIAEISGSARYPNVNLQGSVTRSLSPMMIDMGPNTPENSATTTWNISAPVAYEVDLWGRIAAQREAAIFDALVARESVEAMSISIAAQVTEMYLNIVFQRELRILLEQQLGLANQTLETLVLRFSHGQAIANDLLLQRTQIEGMRAQLVLIDASEAQFLLALATLLGSADTEEFATNELPNVSPLPDLGIPADLLMNRPDLRAAHAQWEAQNSRLAVAVADRLPALRLSATLILQSANLSDILNEIFWSAVGTVTQPIFGGNRLNLTVELNELGLDEQALNYGQKLLVAMHEVEEALVLSSFQEEHIILLTQQLQTATQSLQQEQNRI